MTQTPASLVLQKLDPPGAAIALTMRTQGLLPSVDVATSIPQDQRHSVVDFAAGCLLPTGWYAQPLSNFYEDGGRAAKDDDAVLKALRDDGYLLA